MSQSSPHLFICSSFFANSCTQIDKRVNFFYTSIISLDGDRLVICAVLWIGRLYPVYNKSDFRSICWLLLDRGQCHLRNPDNLTLMFSNVFHNYDFWLLCSWSSRLQWITSLQWKCLLFHLHIKLHIGCCCTWLWPYWRVSLKFRSFVISSIMFPGGHYKIPFHSKRTVDNDLFSTLMFLFICLDYFVWLRITDECSVPKMRIWSIF